MTYTKPEFTSWIKSLKAIQGQDKPMNVFNLDQKVGDHRWGTLSATIGAYEADE